MTELPVTTHEQPVTAETVAAAHEFVAWVRNRREPTTKTTTEQHLLVLVGTNAQLSAQLKRCARLIEAMYGTKKINWTFEQLDALKDHYCEAMQAIALAEGRA